MNTFKKKSRAAQTAAFVGLLLCLSAFGAASAVAATPEENLERLEIVLPTPGKSIANYVGGDSCREYDLFVRAYSP